MAPTRSARTVLRIEFVLPGLLCLSATYAHRLHGGLIVALKCFASEEQLKMDLLRTLETFVVAAEARSLSDAARQLSITPSAVSKQIAALEADLGVILLARTTRGYHLTTLGEDYLRRACRVLAELREARDLARGSLGGPRGIL